MSGVGSWGEAGVLFWEPEQRHAPEERQGAQIEAFAQLKY